ncbi:hypothetical protein HELRODRAFT_183400 [Helobdella robusta]|uniref:Uncharacterized protein n=1 Tax=Helobdella robusta TaxID=6412 RepID=T1FJK6_HELRO|nr:hypothetical protein HELRODRAFT_183400 [Helobdella robusta]ESO11225.1 hypothetical protein HELRODRAFT_183400 [Helobdella robusta]
MVTTQLHDSQTSQQPNEGVNFLVVNVCMSVYVFVYEHSGMMCFSASLSLKQYEEKVQSATPEEFLVPTNTCNHVPAMYLIHAWTMRIFFMSNDEILPMVPCKRTLTYSLNNDENISKSDGQLILNADKLERIMVR